MYNSMISWKLQINLNAIFEAKMKIFHGEHSLWPYHTKWYQVHSIKPLAMPHGEWVNSFSLGNTLLDEVYLAGSVKNNSLSNKPISELMSLKTAAAGV